MREPGFYWVNFAGVDWVVCCWGGGGWTVPEFCNGIEIVEIDERRIVREPSLNEILKQIPFEQDEKGICFPVMFEGEVIKKVYLEEPEHIKPLNIFSSYMEYMVKEFARKTMDEFKALNKD